MINNIVKFITSKRKIDYSRIYLIKYSTSTYLILGSILWLSISPKTFNKYVFKYILPLIITSICISITEGYIRYTYNNANIWYILFMLSLHFIPYYYWFTLNQFISIRHIYIRILCLNILIGTIITSLYFRYNKWPYYETPLEILIIGTIMNILFYFFNK
uniref:Uncharacterized protein n=1 Tax=Megaviridae environmental sample TaxID=1737588 RepID=A0A5J6VLS2_9VIRU|nr:MAG: hypothetical protein [Megaviridae environmental sample]